MKELPHFTLTHALSNTNYFLDPEVAVASYMPLCSAMNGHQATNAPHAEATI